MKTVKMLKALNVLQREVEKRDIPVTWIFVLILVAEAGDKGIHASDLEKEIGVAQGIISRSVKFLSVYYDDKAGKMVGPDLIASSLDPVHRRKFLIRLTPHGKNVVAEMEAILKK